MVQKSSCSRLFTEDPQNYSKNPSTLLKIALKALKLLDIFHIHITLRVVLFEFNNPGVPLQIFPI